MAAKGQVAKDYVAKKLAEVFGEHFLGEVNKKYYVEAPEGKQMVQVAITLTCPKEPVVASEAVNKFATMTLNDGGVDFDTFIAPKPIEISDKERENIQELMERLGL